MQGNRHTLASRPYYWGAIYLSDADCQEEFDIGFSDGGGPVHSTASHVAVSVTHAGTVDAGEADVALEVRVSDRRVAGMPYETVLDLPSGQLYVGDADESDEIALRPGRWLLQFAVDDPEQTRQVEIVASPM